VNSPVIRGYRRISAAMRKACSGTTRRPTPSADQIFSLGRLEECLVSDGPEDEYRRRVIAFHQPLLCSSLESTR